jgi:hypothetical protein
MNWRGDPRGKMVKPVQERLKFGRCNPEHSVLGGRPGFTLPTELKL